VSRGNQHRIKPEEIQATRSRFWKRLARVFVFSLVLSATLSAGWWLNQIMSVRQWEIDAPPMLKQAINVQLEAMPSKDFLHTQPFLLRQQWLAKIPDMAEVQVSRILPDSLHIIAQPRVPMALWQDENNDIHLLDDHAVAYRLLRKGESPDLPLLRIDAGNRAPAFRLLLSMQQHATAKMAVLSEIRASGQSWQINFSRGESWLLPQGREISVIRRLASILKEPRWQHRNWRIDARAQSRWFIRPVKHGGII
jgi:cell division septal protein FtsQ